MTRAPEKVPGQPWHGCWCWAPPQAGRQEGRHLEVSVDDAQAVQVGDGTEDLAH